MACSDNDQLKVKGRVFFVFYETFNTTYFRNVSHNSDFQEIRQVEASTKFKEPSIMDEDSIGSFSRRNDQDNDDLSDLLSNKKV